MANLTTIQPYGNQLVAVFDDGSRKLAYPTSNGVYTISNPGEAPEPPPDPSVTRFAWPFSLDLVTSEYGMRNGRLHAGIDFGRGIANVRGTPIPAASAGTVWRARVWGGYGNAVILDHGGGLFTLYGHMTDGSMKVTEGQTVTQGQELGGIGNTGNSRGLHLHFETHEGGYRYNNSSRDPRLFFQKYNV